MDICVPVEVFLALTEKFKLYQEYLKEKQDRKCQQM